MFWLLLPLALLIVFVGVIFFFQRSLLYFPSHMDTQLKGLPPFETFRNEEGQALGYAYSPSHPSHLVLFFHGNGGEALHRTAYQSLFSDAVLVLAEYPGYGGVQGSPSQRTILENAEKTYDAAVKKWNLPVWVAGESLGAGVATWIASTKPVQKLALISPYFKMSEVAAFHYPWLPVRWLLLDSYPSGGWIEGVTVPIHMIHGSADSTIPISQARKLLSAAGSLDKTLSVLPNVDHNGILEPILHAPEASAFRNFLRH